MSVYTTEIASATIPSDNPVHQRLYSAYVFAQPYIKGNLFEVGCGEGRGVELLAPLATSYTAIDKIQGVIDLLKGKYPKYDFRQAHIPPFRGFDDNSFDVVVSFQVIEHIKDDIQYLKEINRVLKPGGIALITTPNIKNSLSRNPWHEREYTAEGLTKIAEDIFRVVDMKGITGNEKVLQYHEENRKSVNKVMRWDIFNLQHRLPASWLRVPYDILNRRNRNKLMDSTSLAAQIRHEDFFVTNEGDEALDLFLIVSK